MWLVSASVAVAEQIGIIAAGAAGAVVLMWSRI